MFYQTSLMFGPTTWGIAAPRPDVTIFGWHLFSDKGFYYVLLVFVVLTVVVVQAILRGRMGRLLKGLRRFAGGPRDPRGDGQRHEGAGVLHLGRPGRHRRGLLASLYDYGLGTNYSSFSSLTMVAIVVLIVIGRSVVRHRGRYHLRGHSRLHQPRQHLIYYESMLFGLLAATFAVQVNRVPSVPLGLRRLHRPPGAAEHLRLSWRWGSSKSWCRKRRPRRSRVPGQIARWHDAWGRMSQTRPGLRCAS